MGCRCSGSIDIEYLYVRKHLEYGVINDVFQVFFCYNYDILGLRGCRTLRRKEYAGSRKKRENVVFYAGSNKGQWPMKMKMNY